jgi:hypothetical protein
MARFIFTVQGRSNSEEVELPTVAAAKCEALHYASKIVCEEPTQFWNSGEFQMTVSDEKRLILFALTISGFESPAIRADSRISS